MLVRKKYLKKIKPFIGKDVIKVITGQRRSGKSFVLKSIIEELKNTHKVSDKNICYINKELISFDYIDDYKKLYEEVKNFKHIFIDEIQDIKDREKAIRSLQAEGGKDIYITGSNSNLLSGELATYLSGRYVSFSINPFDYKEFLEAYKLENNIESFDKYLEFGGMPYLLNIGFGEQSWVYLKNIFDTIVLNDVIQRNKIRNVSFFKKLIVFLSQNVGSIFSSLKISNFLSEKSISLSSQSINEYIEYSNNAMFLHSVERYDLVSKKVFERKQKNYFTDVGIRNVIVGGLNRKDLGGILENIVFSNLNSNGYQVFVGEYNGKEIDFVAIKNEKKIYIQVCYLLTDDNTIKREFENISRIPDNRPKYVISLDKYTGGDFNGVIHKTIYDFILEDI